jgi:hypothetical protein
MVRLRAGSDGIGYEGLNQLNRDLKAVGKEAQGELKKANVTVAKKEGDRARAAAFGLGGVSAHVAPGIQGSGGNAWAGIRLGSDPAAGGAEFGGQRRPTTQQFRPWLGHTGYAVYPTIRRDNEEITSTWFEAIENLMKEHGL